MGHVSTKMACGDFVSNRLRLLPLSQYAAKERSSGAHDGKRSTAFLNMSPILSQHGSKISKQTEQQPHQVGVEKRVFESESPSPREVRESARAELLSSVVEPSYQQGLPTVTAYRPLPGDLFFAPLPLDRFLPRYREDRVGLRGAKGSHRRAKPPRDRLAQSELVASFEAANGEQGPAGLPEHPPKIAALHALDVVVPCSRETEVATLTG